MHNRKFLTLSALFVLVMAILSGCAMGAPTPPRDAAAISVDEALAAQEAGMAGIMMGSVEWTESQFSSFLTVLLQQNTGENSPIESVNAWFDAGNKVFLRVQLKDGVLLGGGTIDLAGTIGVADMHVNIDITEASANGFMISGAALAPLNAQINAALSDPSMGVAVNVETGEGTLKVSLGGM